MTAVALAAAFAIAGAFTATRTLGVDSPHTGLRTHAKPSSAPGGHGSHHDHASAHADETHGATSHDADPTHRSDEPSSHDGHLQHAESGSKNAQEAHSSANNQ